MIRQIGKYQIQSELARGGFARVYRGLDPAVGRPVAIKVLEGHSDKKLLARFSQEAAAAGNLHHRNIVTIYEFGDHEGNPFLAMEFLDGHNLHDLMSNKTALSLAERVRILHEIASGLAAAHRNGVVHRDIKPSNVMVTSGNAVKLMDFGIARVTRRERLRLTQSGDLVGTVLYMAPEQFRNSETDALSDIFSFGVLSYELLSGSHPFAADDIPALMYRVTHEEPARFQNLALPLEKIVFRALEKDRRLRYQSMEDLRYDLEPVLREMHRDEAAALLAEARTVLSAGNPDASHLLVRKALELDPTSTEARNLRGAIQAIENCARVDSLMLAAAGHIERRQFADAVEALELVRRLDPTRSEAQSKLTYANERLEASRRITSLVAEATRMMERQDFAAAERLAFEAIASDSAGPEADRILDAARAALAQRNSEREVKRALTRAKGLLLLGETHRAISLLDSAGTAPELENARRQALDLEQRRSAVRQLLEQNNFEEALCQIEDALRHFPADPEIIALLHDALARKHSIERKQIIAEQLQKCERLASLGELTQAVLGAEALRLEFGDVPEVLTVLANLRARYRTGESILELQTMRDTVAHFIAQQRFHSARILVTEALNRYPGDARLTELLRNAERSISGSSPSSQPAPPPRDSVTSRIRSAVFR